MVKCKLVATYTPDNTIVTPDAAAGAWGDALVAWAAFVNTYNASALENVTPSGGTVFEALDYAKNALGNPVIRSTVMWNAPCQITDLVSVQAIFKDACSQAGAEATLAAFDSSGSMSFADVAIEVLSDIKTL